jgi:hypothetical protein
MYSNILNGSRGRRYFDMGDEVPITIDKMGKRVE